MEDTGILDLFWARDEQALEETEKKYGSYCRTISYQILKNKQDAEECVNDSYIKIWNAIPPQRPFALGAFLAKIVRNRSINCYRTKHTLRRGGGQIPLLLEELADCASDDPEQLLEAAELTRALDRFLRQLPPKECCLFLRRYWYMDSIVSIAQRYHLPQGTVKSTLFRTRQKLRVYLVEEGFYNDGF